MKNAIDSGALGEERERERERRERREKRRETESPVSFRPSLHEEDDEFGREIAFSR